MYTDYLSHDVTDLCSSKQGAITLWVDVLLVSTQTKVFRIVEYFVNLWYYINVTCLDKGHTDYAEKVTYDLNSSFDRNRFPYLIYYSRNYLSLKTRVVQMIR